MKIKLLNRFLLLPLLLSWAAMRAAEPDDTLVAGLHDCDLLFQICSTGNAITEVTSGASGLAIDHVAIFARIESRPSVIEALPGRGVCITPIDSFLGRRRFSDGRPAVVVGRVGERLDTVKTVAAALSLVGCGYDSLYLPDNREIYCSELVLRSYVDSMGEFVFEPVPMTFRDSEGRIPDYWTEFYARHGMPVPEGWMGSNPGELSRRVGIEGPTPALQKGGGYEKKGGCQMNEKLSDE